MALSDGQWILNIDIPCGQLARARKNRTDRGGWIQAATLKFSKAIALLTIGFACGNVSAATPGVALQSVKGGFDDIKERIVMAIENRGLPLNYTAHISTMLERTGK